MSNLIYISDPLFEDIRSSVNLDGAAEYFQSGSKVKINIADEFSVMCVFKFNSLNLLQTITTISDVVTAPYGANSILMFKRAPGNDDITVNLVDSSGVIFKNYKFFTASAGEWYHVIFTWDGTNLKLYKDGQVNAPSLISTDLAGSMTDTVRWVTIGRQDPYRFNGRVSQEAVWDVALSADEVEAIYRKGFSEEFDLRRSSGKYTKSANLRHWWKPGFDSNDIGKDYARFGIGPPIDIMGNANAITSADIEDDYQGLDDKAIDLDGSTERFETSAQDNTLGFVNELTFFLVYKPGTKGWVCQVASASQSVNQIRVLNGNSGNQFRVLLGTTSKDYYNNAVMSTGTWATAAFTWDGTNLKLYVDGAEIAVTKGVDGALTRLSVADESVSFGSSFGGGAAHADGRLHSVAFWNKALSPVEILAVHNGRDAGAFNLKKNQGKYESAGNLVQWWRHGWKGAAALGDNEIPSGADLDEVNITAADIVTDRPS
jgi:hypothetical protein